MDGHAYTGDSTTSTSEQGGRSQPRALLNSSDEDQLGLVPRCLSSLFDLIEERTQGAQGNASGGGEDAEFSPDMSPDMTVRVSFLQVNHRFVQPTAHTSHLDRPVHATVRMVPVPEHFFLHAHSACPATLLSRSLRSYAFATTLLAL